MSDEITKDSSGQFPLKFLAAIFVVVPIIIFLLSQNNPTSVAPSDASVRRSASVGSQRNKIYPSTPEGDLERLQDLAADNPSVVNLANLGMAYYNAGKFQQTIETNEKILLLDSRQPVVLNNTCAAYNKLDDYFKAKIFCKKALDLRPDFELAKNNLIEAEDREKRIETLLAAEKNSPTAAGLLELGLHYFKINNLQRAEEVFKSALKLAPGDAALLNNLCATQCQAKLWMEAVPTCKSALAADPESPMARGNLQWAEDGAAGKA